MAAGEYVAWIIQALPPAANAATPDTRAGGSTPAEGVAVWDFDASTQEYMDFLCLLTTDYNSGGLTVGLVWSASSATSGTTRWDVAIRAFPDDAEDLDSAHTYAFNGVSDTAPSVSGEVSQPTVTFTDGADMDSVAAGEMFILRVSRDPANGDDDMSGDAELWPLPSIKES